MNRITSIFLALTFVLYLGGMQLMYWLRIDAARHDAKVYMLKENNKSVSTKELTFSTSEYNALQWLEDNKEFVLNGQRYDIISITNSIQGIKISCYIDNEETEIANAFEHFAERLFNTHQQSSNNGTDVISKITKEYLPYKVVDVQIQTIEQVTFIIDKKSSLLQSPVSDIWHPPAIC